MTRSQSLIEQDKALHFPTYKRMPLVIAKGKLSRVFDTEDNEYIDAFAGIAVNNVGHCHPKVVKAIQKQTAELMHISNFFLSEPQVALEEKLTKLTGMDKVFFSNSGAEAVEGALKLARKYGHKLGKKGKIFSMSGCFHGRTIATIASGKRKYQEGFDPMPEGFEQLPFNDIAAMEAKLNKDAVAVIIELVQGEGGIQIASPEYIKRLREICDKYDILLITDQVQCGMGRTGKMFSHEHYGIKPDIMTLAKALGSGFPIGAILAKASVADVLNFGEHGTTFGGNPLACAAALATIEVIEEEKLVNASAEKGEYFRNYLASRADECGHIREIRGLGLMTGIELDFEGAEVISSMMKKGVLANCTEVKVIRIVPALNITKEELKTIADTLIDSIKEIKTK